MVRLVMILLGVDYLRTRWRTLLTLGLFSIVLGGVIFTDALDGSLYFPIMPFALLMLLEGLATLAVAWTGMGGQRTLRYVKGTTFCLSALLVLIGGEHGNFVLSLIFGTLFLVDGTLQIISARVVRFRKWRLATAGGVLEIAIAIFFYQPYPDHYAGTVAYCVAFGLFFGGWNMILLAARVRRMAANPAVEDDAASAALNAGAASASVSGTVYDGPPGPDEAALTVHVWTPVGSAKAQAKRQLIVDRYIAAIDRNGTISTGHAALESPEGVYISLYPAVEIDRSPNEFSRTLRATRENDVPGLFQPDYATESKAWCPSTQQVRIRNYDPGRLARFWNEYRRDETYNLTYRNCSSTVARALEAAIEGASARVWGKGGGWRPLVRIMTTPELWVAAQVRKRAATMAWTPGLTLDYARALSMLADPRPSGWVKMARIALATMYRSRQRWRAEEHAAAHARETASATMD
ncbi:membrane protein [Caballeronia peredens]|nr:membrane protein [Caballeronia peredens]